MAASVCSLTFVLALVCFVLCVDFGKLITDETDKWAKVIKFANIKAE
jgi:hypothetical protein